MPINAVQTQNSRSTAQSPGLIFGWELILDVYECNRGTISDEAAIKKFARGLCEAIGMKPYGEPLTPYFGEKLEHTKGYSLLQFVETSSIVGHFSEGSGAVYLNIFSCKEYDIEKAEDFAKEYFGAERAHSRFIIRE
jgi:S-adenosylmethionine decarboxylase